MTTHNRPEPGSADAPRPRKDRRFLRSPLRRLAGPPGDRAPAGLAATAASGRTLTHHRILTPALSAALLGALLVPGAPAQGAARAAAQASGHAAARTAAAPVPVLTWTKCGGGFQCATARVPLDYNRPLGRTISIALIRLPAGDRAHRVGSLLVNPGGPGSSGVAEVRGYGRFFPPELRARFDLVGFDPRGVAQSSPVRCFADQAEQRAFFAGLPAFPVTPAQDRAYLRAAAEFDRRCGQRNPDLLAHMSTANAARDMDLLRQALGDEKLSYFGVSYGSYLGTTYANLFPDKVRALVLDGAVEPVQWASGHTTRQPVFLRQHSDLGSSRTLGAFLERCAAAGPRGCPFAVRHDPAATRHRFQALLARLRAHPLPVSTPHGTVQISYATTVSVVLTSLYGQVLWGPLSDALAHLDHGDGRPALELATPPPSPTYDNTRDAWMAVMCADTDGPHDLSAWPRLAAAADRRAPYFGAAWTWSSVACAHWPARDTDRFTGPYDRHTANPVLVVGTTFDPATPYRNAVALSRELGNARLLTLHGWGHTAFFQPSTCAIEAETRYLVDLQLPAPGTVCRPDVGPFDQPSSAADRAARAFARGKDVMTVRDVAPAAVVDLPGVAKQRNSR